MGWDRSQPVSDVYRAKAHKDARAQMLRDYRPGDPCCLCRHPMWPLADGSVSHLHADHDPVDPTRYRGLAHGTQPCQDCGVKCNVVDGAQRGRARQITTTLTW